MNHYLGISGDNEIDTITLSDLIETYPFWENFVIKARNKFKCIKLFTMFETNDVHPEIVEKMKLFDEVIVPYDYLKDILLKHGVKCKALNFWTSSLIRSKPKVIHKTRDPSKLVFLYNGTNDIRKNVTTLTRVFAKVLENTEHTLIVKTNKPDNLTITKNIQVITEHVSNEQLASFFNSCDYCVTCTRGEGVGLLHLEAKYFNKPIISHDKGVFKQLGVDIIPLPSNEVDIDYTYVPDIHKKVFYGKWWEIDENEAIKVIKKIISN
jgi:glycosyltransferase involved in cell wall biosynthesis